MLGNERMGRTSSSKSSSLAIDKALILCGRDGFKWFVVVVASQALIPLREGRDLVGEGAAIPTHV